MKLLALFAIIWGHSLRNFSTAPGYQAPTADAGKNIIAKVGTQVFLQSLSTDPDGDGDALEHHWSMASKPKGSKAVLVDPDSKTPFFFADVVGTFKIHLVVSDGILTSNLDDVVVTVMKNTSPVIVVDPYMAARVGELIIFDASASMDLELDKLQYRWFLLQAPSGSNALLTASEAPERSLCQIERGFMSCAL